MFARSTEKELNFQPYSQFQEAFLFNSSRQRHHITSNILSLLQLSSISFKRRSSADESLITLSLDFETDCLLLLGDSAGSISLYNTHKAHSLTNNIGDIQHKKRTKFHNSALTSVQWYPTDNGAFLSSAYDGSVNLYDAGTFQIIEKFDMNSPVYKARWSSHGDQIAVACHNGLVCLCDPNTGDSTHSLEGHSATVTCVSWSPCSPFLLASCSKDGSVRIWDVRKGGHGSLFCCLDWQQDHTVFSVNNATSSSDKRRRLNKNAGIGLSNNSYRHIDWEKVEASRAHDAAVLAVQYTPCGRYLLSSGSESSHQTKRLNGGKLRLWDAYTGALFPIHYQSGCAAKLPYDMAIARGSNAFEDVLFLPSGHDGGIHVTPIHRRVKQVNGRSTLSGHIGRVTSVLYSAQFQQLISADDTGVVLVWRVPLPSTKEFITGIDDDNVDEDAKAPERWASSHWRGVQASTDLDGNVLFPYSSGGDNLRGPTRVERRYVPPIIRTYLEDMNRS